MQGRKLARSVFVHALLGCCAFVGPLAASEVEARDRFFADGNIPRLEIEIDKENMDFLRKEARDYVAAALKEDGKTVYPEVWVHLRGSAGSFQGVDGKPGFTISMKKTESGVRFHGMDKFHLHNSPQDPTYVQELLCGELFRAAGVPASRVTHAVVTLNGRKLGLYYLKEGYDRRFLKEHFGDADGNLYDGGFLRDVDQPLQLLSGKGDVAGHGDLKVLLAAAREKDPDKRLQKLEQLLDMDRFLSLVALEVALWDWDGYPMKPNNYRVYHEPRRNKITFIPSGMDQMFADANGTIFPGMGGLVARAVVETPRGRGWYVARLAEVMDTVYQPEALARRLAQLEARLQPVLLAVDAGAGKDYPNQVRALRERIQQRHAGVVAQLKQARPVEFVPWFFEDRLRLNADQARRLDELRQEFDGKLRKVLDAGQLKRLKGLQEDFAPGKWGAGFGLGDLLAKDLLPLLDADEDGAVSRDEFLAGARKLFAACDQDKRGSLDEKALSAGLDRLVLARWELTVPKEQVGAGAGSLLAAALLRRADKNRDRKLSADEWQKAAEGLFQELDGEKKGTLDVAAVARGLGTLLPTVSPRWPGARTRN